MNISIISAIDENNAIGFNNDLLIHIPNDLKRFKTLTMGNSIVMGRKTYDSLPNGALPNRRNIVISRNNNLVLENICVVSSIEDVLEFLKNEQEIFIIGGASIYESFMPIANKLYLTKIHKSFEYTDTFFPEYNKEEWKEVYNEDCIYNNIKYSFVDLLRK